MDVYKIIFLYILSFCTRKLFIAMYTKCYFDWFYYLLDYRPCSFLVVWTQLNPIVPWKLKKSKYHIVLEILVPDIHVDWWGIIIWVENHYGPFLEAVSSSNLVLTVCWYSHYTRGYTVLLTAVKRSFSEYRFRVWNKEAEGLIAQLTMFQFQPNTSVVVASIRTFWFSVLNIAIIYKTIFVMPEIHSCSVHHSIYDHFCSDSTMSPWKLK